MAYSINFLEKKPFDNLTSLACWCYRIMRFDTGDHDSNLPRLVAGSRWGLDFPADIPIQPPERYWAGCSAYGLYRGEAVPEGKQIVAVDLEEDLGVLDLCFIAPSAEALGVEVSLEYYDAERRAWTEVDYYGSHKIVGPALAGLLGAEKAPGAGGKGKTTAKAKKKDKKKPKRKAKK